MENPFFHYVDDFEEEAETFLKKYNCADAVENPRRIPIREIATRLMSLDIVETGAKLRPEELATVLGTYRNSGVSGIGEIVKDIFSGMKGAN